MCADDTSPITVLAALDSVAPQLASFLRGQRWYAGKSRRMANAAFEDVAPLGRGCTLAIAAVRDDAGSIERYAMLLRSGAPGDAPVIATPGEWRGTGHVVEASGEPDAARALLAGFATSAIISTRAGAELRYADVRRDPVFPPPGASALEPRPLGAEQSNTSLRAGGYVFKLFRRLAAGENPEVEVGRHLATRTRFRAMPMLRGSLTWHPASGPPATIGVLQDYVEGDGDGWRWMLDRLRAVGAARETSDALATAVRGLGAVTGDLHAALAMDSGAPGFTPVPARSGDVRRWHDSFLESVARAMQLLESSLPQLQPPADALARELLAARAALNACARLPDVSGDGAFHRIRIHGDFHLGQTMHTPDGFVLMDFEGEPARTLAERQAPACALRDVAGMLRSFDYAFASVEAEHPALASDSGLLPRLRSEFLGGYLDRSNAPGPAFLPRDASARDQLIAFFELDKALYEVAYESNNRPEWLHIPLRGVLRLLKRNG